MNPYEENMVFCPFDSNHHINSCKLQMHIVRCQKNHPNAKIKLCPYNSRHYVKLAEFKDHVENCPFRKIDPWNHQQEEFQALDILPIESGLRIPGSYSNNISADNRPSNNIGPCVEQQVHHQIVDILPIESELRIPGADDRTNNEPEVSRSHQRREKKLNSQTEVNVTVGADVQTAPKTVAWKKTDNATSSSKVEPNASSNVQQVLNDCGGKNKLSEEFTSYQYNKRTVTKSSPSNKNAVPFSYANALKKSSTESTCTVPDTLDIDRNRGKENVQEEPNASGSDMQQLSENVWKLSVNDKYRKNKKH